MLTALLAATLLADVLAPAAGRSPVQLVAARDLVALVGDGHARLYDGEGRFLYTLPPPDDPVRREREARERAALAAERALDALDVPDSERDEDAVADLLAEELSRTRPAVVATEAPPAPLLVTSDGRTLVVLAGSSLLRVQPGHHRPQYLGAAPAGIRALAMTRGGRLFAARAGEILASVGAVGAPGDPLHFTVVDRPTIEVLELAVDPRGGFLALRGAGELDLVSLFTGERRVFRPETPVRSIAVCQGELLAVGEHGVHGYHRDGSTQWLGEAAGQERLACAAAGDGPAILYLPGLVLGEGIRETAHSPLVPADAPISAVASAGGKTWVFGESLGLAQVQLAAGQPVLVGVDSTAGFAARARAAHSPRAAHLESRGWSWHGFMPHLTLAGREGHVAGQRERRWGLIAEWRLGPVPVEATRGLQAAAFTQTPLQPPPEAAPLGPDPDAGCLVLARTRAVAMAQVEPERARSLVTRAGRAAWLPELRLRAERRLGRSESVDFKPTASSDALGLDTADDVRYEIRATWDLPRLVFNQDELGAAQQASRIADMRREIESQVNRLYYERRRLLVAPGAPPESRETRDDLATWQIRIEEIEADLDALSAGGFSRCRQGASAKQLRELD
jgi:hypothetical protein